MTRFAARSRAQREDPTAASAAPARTGPRRATNVASSSRAERERREHAGRSPAERLGAHDPVDERDQAAGDQQRAGRVEVAVPPTPARPSGRSRRRERTITKMPTGTLTRKIDGQPRPCVSRPPSSTPERAADAADRAPHAQRAVALAALGERGRDDREARRRDHGAADALQRACADQQRRASPRARTPARRARTARSPRGTRAGVRAGPRRARRASGSRRR